MTKATEMTKTTKARYTLEFKQEAVRLVKGGQNFAADVSTLRDVDPVLTRFIPAEM